MSEEAAHAKVVDAIYQTVADTTLWPGTIAHIADYVGSAGGVLAYHDLKSREAFFISGRMPDELTDVYLSRHAHNPWCMALAGSTVGSSVFANDIVAPEIIRRTAFHADFLAPQGIEEVVFLTHPMLTRRATSGGLALSLSGRQSGDRDIVAKRLQRLASHFLRALGLSLQVGSFSTAAQSLEAILDLLPHAALLVDGRGRVVRANRRGEALLAERDGLVLGAGGVFKAELASDQLGLTAALREATASDASTDSARPTVVRLSRSSGRTALTVIATPLPPSRFPMWSMVEGGARALVQVIDPDHASGPQLALLQAGLELTPAEARVAALVSEGRTAPEVAALLAVSPATVRTHLARCFDKTGTRSQVALTRLLASLPGRA